MGSLPDQSAMEVQFALTQLDAAGVKVGATEELAPFGRESPPFSPAELAEFIAQERERWTKIIRDGNIRV